MMKRVNAMLGRAAYAMAGAAVAVCCLLAAVMLPSSALAVEPPDGTSSGSTSLTAQVPASYGVTVRIEGCGTVQAVGGAAVRHCPGPGETLVQVGHGVSQRYRITADAGWRVDAVSYGIGGGVQTVSLADGVYTAPVLGQDGAVLRVVFVKADNGDNGPGGTGGDEGSGGNTGGNTTNNAGSNTIGDSGRTNGSSSTSTRLSSTGAAVSAAALMAAVLLTVGVLLLVRRRDRQYDHLD